MVQPSSSLVMGGLFVMFALLLAYRLVSEFHLQLTIAVLALTVMLSLELIGFLMLAVRHEAVSQILGLLVFENGIFLGSQLLVPGMPLLIEMVILFDMLILVACFGVLVRYLARDVGTTSSLELKRLVGWWWGRCFWLWLSHRQGRSSDVCSLADLASAKRST